MNKTVLYGYYRSSAAYRVRIGLALKNIPYETAPIHLVKGEQRSQEFLALNPQGFVPALAIDGFVLAQSQAILEYLDETRPNPAFLPATPQDRALARRLAQIVVADIHPLNNTRVAGYLKSTFSQTDDAVQDWMRHWIAEGFKAFETLVAPSSNGFCIGDQPGLADIILVPQLYNARRFSLDLTPFPTLVAIERNCVALPAFAAAHPDRQRDAPQA
jgi:maleylacetoacetate isomerase